MPSQAQFVAEALAHAKNTKLSVDEFLLRVKGGGYRYSSTEWYKAMKALEAAKTTAPPVPPPPVPNTFAQRLQNVIYCAQDPLAALQGRKPFKPALTADPGYASFTTPDVVAQLKSHFGTCGAWGVQTQIGVQRMRDFQAQYGLDFLIFQGETEQEYDTAIRAGAELIVGNCNAWTDAQRHEATHMVSIGQLAVAMETYTNLGNPWPDQTTTQGVPAASFVYGVYDGSSEQPNGWYPTVADYLAHTPAGMKASVSVYHTAGLRAEDWAAL